MFTSKVDQHRARQPNAFLGSLALRQHLTPPHLPMANFLAELIGTMLLIVLGDGVVANVVLNQTKGNNAGWIVVTTGWALAVTIAVYCVNSISGAHLNPA